MLSDTVEFVKGLAKQDRYIKHLTRFGQLPYQVRHTGPGEFVVEDTRKWEPELGRFTQMSMAVKYIAALVSRDRAPFVCEECGERYTDDPGECIVCGSDEVIQTGGYGDGTAER